MQSLLRPFEVAVLYFHSRPVADIQDTKKRTFNDKLTGAATEASQQAKPAI